MPTNDPLDFLKAEPGGEAPISSEVPPKETPPKETPPKSSDAPPEPKSKGGKGKEDQLRDLADAKKKLEDEKKSLEERLSKYEKVTPLLKVGDKLKERYGDITDEAVNNFIADQEAKEKELEETKAKFKEKDEKLSEINITFSEEWKENYAKPLSESVTNLTALLAEVDNEGKIKHEPLLEGLKQKLLTVNPQTGEPLNSVQIKAIMKQFALEYEEKTKEEYDVPRLNDVVNAVHTVAKLHKSSVDARANWQNTLQEKMKTRAFEEQEKQKALLSKEIAGRQHAYNKVITNFNTKDFEGIFTEDEIKEKVSVPHNQIMKVMKGEEQGYGYDVLLEKLGKAELVEGLIAKVRSLESELDKEIKKNNSGLRMESGRKPVAKSSNTSEDEINNNPDPLAFLKS